MKLNIDFESLDKNAIYCLDCLREDIIEPIYNYTRHCKHAHRNMYTYRFCKDANEWHMSRAFACDVKCATCLIKIANAASHTPKANAARERTMIANGEAAKRNKRITDKDLKKKILQRQKENGEGFWNSELQKENSMKSIAKQRATMTGIFDSNIRTANQAAMKEKKIGISANHKEWMDLYILNKADMHVDSNGNVISFEERLKEIKKRYGEDSKQYKEASNVIDQIKIYDPQNTL